MKLIVEVSVLPTLPRCVGARAETVVQTITRTRRRIDARHAWNKVISRWGLIARTKSSAMSPWTLAHCVRVVHGTSAQFITTRGDVVALLPRQVRRGVGPGAGNGAGTSG